MKNPCLPLVKFNREANLPIYTHLFEFDTSVAFIRRNHLGQ